MYTLGTKATVSTPDGFERYHGHARRPHHPTGCRGSAWNFDRLRSAVFGVASATQDIPVHNSINQ